MADLSHKSAVGAPSPYGVLRERIGRSGSTRKMDTTSGRHLPKAVIPAGLAAAALVIGVACWDLYPSMVPISRELTVWMNGGKPTSSVANTVANIGEAPKAVAGTVRQSPHDGGSRSTKVQQVPGKVDIQAAPVPAWVSTGVSRLGTDVRQAKIALKADDAEIGQLQAALVDSQHREAALKADVSTEEQRVMRLEHQKLQLQVSNRPLPPRRVILSPAPSGIVALEMAPQEKPSVPGKTTENGTETPKVVAKQPADQRPIVVSAPAKGWMVVAVHGGKAVLQAPDGHVAMVRVGSRISGHTVVQVNDARKTVLLNGGILAVMP